VIDGLGVGGFATVVKVEELNSGKRYAMKVISKSSKDSKKDQLSRVKLELELMTSPALNASPFLQKCHDAFENSSNVFFVVDLIEGGDLFTHLSAKLKANSRGFAEFEVRFMLAELHLAIDHLHNNGYLHRDIKIENIMLDRRGHIKLVDYGLATRILKKASPTSKSAAAESSKSSSSAKEGQPMSASGSLIYLAPELLKSSIGGKFTDWWSYGVLAFELLTGHIPWSSMSDEPTIKNEILNKEVTLPELFSFTTRHFVSSLLSHNYRKRLGGEELKKHMYFRGIDWLKLNNQEYIPAFKPNIVSDAQANVESRTNALSIYHKMVRATPSNSSLMYKYSALKFGLKKADLFLV
jgi:serine/threonine protein kinase